LGQAVVNTVLHAKSIHQFKSINTSYTNAILNRYTIGISNTESVSEIKSWQTCDTYVIAQILTALNKEITQIVL
jgi:hypothetical protein